MCPLCKVTYDDELPFVLCCEEYLHRIQYLHRRFCTQPNLSKLSVLLASTEKFNEP